MRDASTLSCPERRGEGDYKFGRCSIIAIAIHPSNLGFQLEITKAGSSNNNNTHNTDNGIDQVWSKLEPEMKQRQRNINPIISSPYRPLGAINKKEACRSLGTGRGEKFSLHLPAMDFSG